MRIDGRGIAVGLGVAIITLIMIGAASHHLHHGYDDDGDVTGMVATTVDGGAGEGGDGRGTETPVASELKSNEIAVNADQPTTDQPTTASITDNTSNTGNTDEANITEKAKEVVNKIVEIVEDNLAKVERAIENEEEPVVEQHKFKQDIPFVDIPIHSTKPKPRPRPERPKKRLPSEDMMEGDTDDEVVKLPQYKESFLDTIIRFFSGPSGGVPREKRTVHAPAAMVRDGRLENSNSFSAFKRAHRYRS